MLANHRFLSVVMPILTALALLAHAFVKILARLIVSRSLGMHLFEIFVHLGLHIELYELHIFFREQGHHLGSNRGPNTKKRGAPHSGVGFKRDEDYSD